MTSVSFFHVFIVNNCGKFPGVGVLNSFFAQGLGIRPSKNCPGRGRGWSGLELTDTYRTSQFNRHIDSSLKVIDISIGLIQLMKLDKISFYRQIS